MQNQIAMNAHPTLQITVAIPTHNGRQRLPAVFDALKGQVSHPYSWEVLVVDNCSTDGTSDWVQTEGAEHLPDIEVRCIFERKKGVGFARQAAVMAAKGRLIAFLDDDLYPANDWVEQAVRFFEDNPELVAANGCIKGRFMTDPPEGFERIASFFALFEYAEPTRPYNANKMDLPPGAGLIVDRKAWMEYVPSRLSLARGPGEDWEALLYLAKSGKEMWYSSTLTLTHLIPETRFEPDYLKNLMYTYGRIFCFLQRVGKSKRAACIIVPKVISLSIVHLVKICIRQRMRFDLVTKCQMRFWWHAALSPLYGFAGRRT